MNDTPLADLAGFAAALDGTTLPGAVREAVALHVLDFTGGMAVGGGLPGIADLVEAFTDRGPVEATVPGFGKRFGATEAAGLCAMLGHVAESDAIHTGSTLCVDLIAVPPVLALAEARSVAGNRAVAAIVAGIEVAARTGMALGSAALLGHGWWPTAVVGGAGAAAATAVALGLDATATRNAMSLALVQMGGAGVGAPEAPASRNLLCANAVRHGVEAALLAESGLAGPAEPFLAPRGLAGAFPTAFEAARLTEGLGEDWAILKTSLKTFPCALQAQTALDALRGLLAKTPLRPGDVQSVAIALPAAMLRIVDRPGAPRSHLGAAASLQFLCAAMIHDGDITQGRLEAEGRADPALLALAEKVTVTHDAALDARFPAQWPARVTLRHAGGEETASADVPPGHPARPLDRNGVAAKFRTLAGSRLGAAAAEIEMLCLGIGGSDDAAAIPRALDAALRG
jgi:2-methylcitrate dehydratase PrpD